MLLSYCIPRESDLREFSHNIIVEVQIVWKISSLQCYWWQYWNAKKSLNFQKFKLNFASPKQQAACWKLFSTKKKKNFLRLWNKRFCNRYLQEYTDTWFPNASRMQWLEGIEVVQCKCFFWHQPETYLWLCYGGIFL